MILFIFLGIDIKNFYPTKPESVFVMEEVIALSMEIMDKCPRDDDVEVMMRKRKK